MAKKLKTKKTARNSGDWYEIFQELIKGTWELEDWLKQSHISASDQETFTDARKAAQLKRSKLYKALK
jgi:hypothetical protein